MRVLVDVPLLLALIASLRICSTFAQEAEFACDSLPAENYTCAACIEYHKTCAWCTQEGFEDKYSIRRCGTKKTLLKAGCNEGDIENPETYWEITKDKELSNQGTDIAESEATQLKPQEVHVWIRPKDRVTFPVTYKQAVDYPVDLYYLMDLSNSMSDDKKKLSELGDLLAERMKAITNNFRLGFGSFIDKKIMPFVDPRPKKHNFPCKGCAPPYGFRNDMPLSINTKKFSNRVNASKTSGNLDAPEGGFDAIMQSLACRSEIGWRNKSRKMIVYSSDAGFHYAGDGKLAGVVVPNDGECHLDSRGEYTKSNEQDYPSIALLHQKIVEAKANLIFAVSQQQVELYRRLKDALPDVSSSVGELADDSKNVVDLIETEYRKISQKIIMVDDLDPSSGLKLSYRSKCLGNVWNDTNVCDGIKVGGSVTFNVTLDALECNEQKDYVIRLGPSGLSEAVIVRVKVLCDCNCELDAGSNKNDIRCNGSGTYMCGICDCNYGWVGTHCQCSSRGESTAALDAMCRRTNDSAICEGRGVCECGRCICNKRTKEEEKISGQYCQCDNFNCPRHDRKICSDHGRCVCQKCECDEDWTGRACQCPKSQDSCIGLNGEICSGRGECICGVCSCHGEAGKDGTGTDSKRYSGPTCDICPTCAPRCVEYRPCVRCQGWKKGPYNDTKCAECPFKIIKVKELPEVNPNRTQELCQFVDTDDDCQFYFLYDYNERDGNITVWVKEHRDCPPPVPILAIVLGVIAGIVLIGLILLLVWKLLTLLHDRREFARFEKERLLARWDTGQNPIFQPATTTFKNPAYGGGK